MTGILQKKLAPPGSTVGGGSDVSGLATFWTDGGSDNFTIHTVTDMSSLAGNAVAFADYVKTTEYIPEPATAHFLCWLSVALPLAADAAKVL